MLSLHSKLPNPLNPMHIAILHSSSDVLADTLIRTGMQPEFFLTHDTPAPHLAKCAGFILLDHVPAAHMQILSQQSQLGKPLLGMGQGAECLVRYGLIPGLENQESCIMLTDVTDVAQTMRLTEHYQLNAFTHYLTVKDSLSIAATSRRFVLPPGLRMEMQFFRDECVSI